MTEIGEAIGPLEVVVSADDVGRYAAAARLPGTRFRDEASARAEGLPGRILPGNMTLAIFCRMLAGRFPTGRVTKLGATYRGVVFPEKTLRLSGFVTEVREESDGTVVECDLLLECDGERRVTGVAVLAIPAAG